MPQKTHYQDDLFVISTLVKALEAALAVEADAEFFRERLAGDFFFIDTSIKNFHTLLSHNEHLIDRVEYMKLLERTAVSFGRVVRRLLAGDCPRAEDYAAYHPQLEAVLESQRTLVTELEALLASAGEGNSGADVVSEDELSELLKS